MRHTPYWEGNSCQIKVTAEDFFADLLHKFLQAAPQLRLQRSVVQDEAAVPLICVRMMIVI